jgi:hypothetical protein
MIFCNAALICVLLASVSIAQDIASEQSLQKAGYLLSVESARLKILRTDLLKIRKKIIVLNGLDNPQIIHITSLIEHILLAETIFAYESLLLKTLNNLEENKKKEQYNFHYLRLKESTLNRLYLNFKSTQSNIAKIDNKEILQLAEKSKDAMLRALQEIKKSITILGNQTKNTP